MQVSTLDLGHWLRPGDAVLWGQATAEPRTLTRALVQQRHALGRLRVFVGIGLADTLAPEHADTFDFVGYTASGSHRALARAGLLDVLPVHYSQLAGLIRRGALRIDAVLAQVSPPDGHGRHCLGMAHEYLGAALAAARVVIAEVHPEVPWVHGAPTLCREQCAAIVDAELPLAEPAAAGEPSTTERAIAAHVASLVDDGATLQMGIGAVPDAVLATLADRRDLGLHTGAVGESVVALAESGALTHARKNLDPGVGIGGLLLGGARLRRWAHRNPGFALRASDYTHGPAVLASVDRLVAINSALEVDLTGQVNAEVAGGTYVGAVGGAVDFLRGAAASRSGVPIVALPATAGAASRIVAALGGPVSTSRADAGVVVTEHGIADLRGQPLGSRVRRLIAIAAPEHREALAREAHALLARAGAAFGR